MFLFVRLKKDLFPAVVFLEASIVCVSLSGCSDALAVFAGKTLSSAVSSAVSSSVSSAASSAASSAVSSAASSHTAAASPSSSVSYAPGADPPDNNGTASFSETARSGDMVDLQTFIPSLAVDLRYATTNNFTGTVIYNFSRAYLRRGTAVKLAAVVRTLKAEGYTLKVWDAYRPQWAQQKLWDFKPDPVYIANPEKGSNHTRGNTVDVTLMKNGKEVAMPSRFDDFSSLADTDFTDVSAQAGHNARILEKAMTANGFTLYKNEWWHFADSTRYDMISFDPSITRKSPTVSLDAVGDCTLGNDYRIKPELTLDYYVQKLCKPLTYFLSCFKDTFLYDDLTIANSEGVFTTSTSRVGKSSQGSDRAFWFRCTPSDAAIYTQNGIDAVDIANNHALDYGIPGLEQSNSTLSDQGLVLCGYGYTGYVVRNGVRIGLLGYNLVGALEQGVNTQAVKATIKSELARLSQYTDIQIVYFHWGVEYRGVTWQQEMFGRYAIDCGADLVLGAHPHVIQPVVCYKGCYIAYSLGNFLFGGSVTPSGAETFVLSVKFTLDVNREITNEACSIIPAMTYAGSPDDYQPFPVTGSVAAQIRSIVGITS